MPQKRDNIIPVRLTDSELTQLDLLVALHSKEGAGASRSFILRYGFKCLPHQHYIR